MLLNKRLRKAIAMGLYWPFVARVTLRSLWVLIRHPRRVLFEKDETERQPETLAFRGMSGQFSGTIATLFAKRADLVSALPPEMALVDADTLPDWLPRRDQHPLIFLIGKQIRLGRRKWLLGRYRTVPLFRPYLETFVAVPFLKPKVTPTGIERASPCFCFVRIPCAAFWPTEFGIHRMGYPKVQCPMHMRVEDGIQHYAVRDERGAGPWLSAQTDLSDPVPLDVSHGSLQPVISMMSQPLVLIRNGELRYFSFDLRFEAAATTAVPASVRVHPGFLPCFPDEQEFSLPRITDAPLGAFFLETTFLNRPLDET